MPFDGQNWETKADQLLACFGENGEYWGQRHLVENGRMCLLGALAHINKKEPHQYWQGRCLSECFDTLPGLAPLVKAVMTYEKSLGNMMSYGRPHIFNDANDTSFRDIKAVLELMREIELQEMAHAV